MHDAETLLHDDLQQTISGMMISSGSQPFVQPEYMQLTQEAPVSRRIRRTVSERLSRRLEEKNEEKMLSLSADYFVERVKELTLARHKLMLH